MPLSNEKIKKLITIARLYYEENKTQNEIAGEMGISRALISRYLTEARNYGVVKIQIQSPIEEAKLMLENLQQKFGIRGGYVVANSLNEADTNRDIANVVIEGMKALNEVAIGVGWGSIIGTITQQLLKKTPMSTVSKVYPLVGNSRVFNRNYHPSEIISIFGEKTGGTPVYWSAPAFVESAEDMKKQKELDSYKIIESGWKSMKVAFVNIGNYPSVPDFATAASYGNKLSEQKAVGKLLCYYYDINGHFIKPNMECTMQIPMEILSKRKFVVGICGANVHPRALEGALKTGIFTHIVAAKDIVEQITKNSEK